MTDQRFDLLLAEALSEPQIRDGIERSSADPDEVAAGLRAEKDRILGQVYAQANAEDAVSREVSTIEEQLTANERKLARKIMDQGVTETALARIVRLHMERLEADIRLLGLTPRRLAMRSISAAVGRSIKKDVPGFKLSLGDTATRGGAIVLLPLLGLYELFLAWRIVETSGIYASILETWRVIAAEAMLAAIAPVVVVALLIGAISVIDATTSRVIAFTAMLRFGRPFLAAQEQLEQSLTTARLRLKACKAATDRAVLRNLMAELRLRINATFGPSYATALPAVRPSGLAEVFDERYEIPTAAKKDVLRKLETMPGGAIGIGGPRGAGKSTLLRSIANGVAEITSSGETRPVLGVLTAAPVQYDARDFLLHLFARTCTRVLGGQAPRMSDDDLRQRIWTQWGPKVRNVIAPIAVIAAAAGPLMLTLGSLSLVSSTGSAFLHQLQGKPIELIARGVFWCVAAIVLVIVRSYLADRADPVARAEQPTDPPKPPAYTGTDEQWQAIVTSARQWDSEIRFQRTYSQGWSGALKLPVGMEGSVNQALSWSHRQLSLPELTKAYTAFLAELATHMIVVIAIDELDKIGSDQKAQDFLNEIKAIFGIERCFYLLSVSDSAMSSFARRGLPIRDAFDSALDEVVRVEYLTHTTANELISRRIVRFPSPFVSFCHCLSGGLPRDVIRACRDVFDAAEKIDQHALPAVMRAVLADDLHQKISATITAIAHAGADDEATVILERLGSLRTDRVEPPTLLADYSDLRDAAAETKSAACRSVAIDLATYYLYASTMIEIFDDVAATDTWTVAANAALFEELAALRRRLEIDSEAIRRELLALRA
ncbi:MAG TPA: hypothetical protein VEU30_14675, partial [Thermoanaerobaculia bacterium]|nr:hypothetical protein [Thermoanaerobaculia bacterium]